MSLLTLVIRMEMVIAVFKMRKQEVLFTLHLHTHKLGCASSNAQSSPKNAQSGKTNASPSSSLQFGTAGTHYENEIENYYGRTTSKTPNFEKRNHLVDQILPKTRTRATRRNVNHFEDDVSLLSMFEPKCFEEATKDKN